MVTHLRMNDCTLLLSHWKSILSSQRSKGIGLNFPEGEGGWLSRSAVARDLRRVSNEDASEACALEVTARSPNPQENNKGY